MNDCVEMTSYSQVAEYLTDQCKDMKIGEVLRFSSRPPLEPVAGQPIVRIKLRKLNEGLQITVEDGIIIITKVR